jgi:hypothetical protein
MVADPTELFTAVTQGVAHPDNHRMVAVRMAAVTTVLRRATNLDRRIMKEHWEAMTSKDRTRRNHPSKVPTARAESDTR